MVYRTLRRDCRLLSPSNLRFLMLTDGDTRGVTKINYNANRHKGQAEVYGTVLETRCEEVTSHASL